MSSNLPADPNHITLNISPETNPSSKPSKILRFSRDRTINQALKERSRTFHQLSLNYASLDAYYVQAERVIINLKQLKSLAYLNIDLRWLTNIYKDTPRLFESLKHLKNLKVLHFHASEIYTVVHSPSLPSLCENIRKLNTLLRCEIKLSLSIFKYVIPEQLKKLLESFSKLKRLSSVQITFFNYDLPHIQQAIITFKNSKSLHNLSLLIDQCELGPPNQLQDLLGTFTSMKSLKDSKFGLKKCDDVTYLRLKELLPILKEVTRVINFELAFEKCTQSITLLEQWKFKRAVKNIKSSKKIQANFVSEKKKKVTLATALCFGVPLIFLLLLPFFIVKIVQVIP